MITPKNKIDFNPQFENALSILQNSDKHVFITGRAGTGKSTLLSYFRSITKIPYEVAAPTGVAAINVNGVTIHSLFSFPPNVTYKDLPKIYRRTQKNHKLFKELKLLIIDEISMVRADLMDCIDRFLQLVRENKSPFGGLRIIMFGDLYQLPPVAKHDEEDALLTVYESPYFYSSEVIQKLIADNQIDFIELEKIYRQTEPEFIEFLNKIRNKTILPDDLNLLNTQIIPIDQVINPQSDAVTLTTMNIRADEINTACLVELPGSAHAFEAEIIGNFEKSAFPTDDRLLLKKQARVMFVQNDSLGRWVNGTMGTITGFETDPESDEPIVKVKIDNGTTQIVAPFKFELSKTVYDIKNKTLTRETVGSFTQIPLRLAWALTIHKAQGKTFEKIVIDLFRSAFAPGQTYVALSRAVSLRGIKLVRPIKPSDVRLDYRIVKFLTNFQYYLSDITQNVNEKEYLLRQAIENKNVLEITYLKAKNEKSIRKITPLAIEEQEFNGKIFTALVAFCHTRQSNRIFNLKRILKVDLINQKN
jgi:ATP-dependent DNA helicase PIF1